MRSMTGFGQASWQGDGRRIVVEARSLNQRSADARLNLPREYQPWETELRQLVIAAVARGKVDVNVSRSGSSPADFSVEIDEDLARASVDGWRRLQKRLRLPGEIDVSFLIGRNEFVRVVERRRDPSTDIPRVRRLLKAALEAMNREREREGRALAHDMRVRAKHLQKIERALQRRTETLRPELARRVAERVARLLGDQGISQERLAQEVALLAERADVTEELVRLRSHLQRLQGLLGQRRPVGKALDFLLQEIHREINTVGSKSADLGVTNLTLEAKGEIEKLREQAQNIE